MKKTRVLLLEEDPLIRTAVGLTLQNLSYAIIIRTGERGARAV